MDTALVRPGDNTSTGAAGLAPAALQRAARRMSLTKIEGGSWVGLSEAGEGFESPSGLLVMGSSALLRGLW